MKLPKYIKKRYWKDYLPAGMTLEVDIPEDMTLINVFENGIKNYADKICMVFGPKEFSYKELNQLTIRFANALSKLNIKKGDIVAIWLPNCPQFSISYYAILLNGASLTAVSPLFVARELAYQVKDSGAKFLIILDRFFPQYEKVKDELPLDKVIVVNIEGKTPEVPENDKIVHFNTLMGQDLEPTLIPKAEINPKQDIAVIQYTGGTTGLPKGACLSHHNIVANILQIKQISDYMKATYLKEDIKSICVLPWYHIYGQTCDLALAPMTGAKGYIFPTFDMEKIYELMKNERPNTMLGVPTMFIGLLSHPAGKDIDFSCLKFVNVGASAMPIEMANAWQKRTGFAIGEGYGLSETSPGVTNSPPWARKKPGSCGHADASTLVGIINENLEFLPIGEAGEFVVSGPQVMLGYHNRPEENEKVFFEAGGYKWLRTGDFAKLDKEGYIYILDRVKDLIKYKGHSVYPREVEEILYEHPAVQECSVIGVKDPVKGEDIKAFIILKNDYIGKITENEIIEWSRENLAAYKYPRMVEFVSSLPKSAIGKVLRRSLREKEEEKSN
ncbi:MAG: long-chain fatty acid--CoA ligase [Promethearchaeota archaeon]